MNCILGQWHCSEEKREQVQVQRFPGARTTDELESSHMQLELVQVKNSSILNSS